MFDHKKISHSPMHCRQINLQHSGMLCINKTELLLHRVVVEVHEG